MKPVQPRSVKTEVMRMILRLPDDCTLEEIQYQLLRPGGRRGGNQRDYGRKRNSARGGQAKDEAMAQVACAPLALKHLRRIVDQVAHDSPTHAASLGGMPDGRSQSAGLVAALGPSRAGARVGACSSRSPCALTGFPVEPNVCRVVAVIHSKQDFRKANKRIDSWQ